MEARESVRATAKTKFVFLPSLKKLAINFDITFCSKSEMNM